MNRQGHWMLERIYSCKLVSLNKRLRANKNFNPVYVNIRACVVQTKTIHMAKHVEKPNASKNLISKLPGRELLNNFTTISEGNENERVAAIKSILNYLSSRQSKENQARKLVIICCTIAPSHFIPF